MSKDHKEELQALRSRLKRVSYYKQALGLLSWDQATLMPEKGAEERARVSAFLSGRAHQEFVALNHDHLLDELVKAVARKKLTGKSVALVREVKRDYDQTVALPEEFVAEFAEAQSASVHAWQKAKSAQNFSAFKPHLEKMVTLSQTKAGLLGRGKPYDELLQLYEPGMTAERLTSLFTDLKEFLVPLVPEIKARQKRAGVHKPLKMKGQYPAHLKAKLTQELAERMGFDPSGLALGVSTHPFTDALHPHDVRFTYWDQGRDIVDVVMVVLHEGGHGLYEAGLPYKQAGTPWAEPVSVGVHESQSRFWENSIGRSLPFWQFQAPRLKKLFPDALKMYSAQDFHNQVNRLNISPVRLEADELTCHLHIALRFELERALVEGELKVTELSTVWNQTVKNYLGVSPKHDGEGVLQDIHWSCGYFGYFPTYSIGSLYAIELEEAIRNDLKDFDRLVKKGEFAPILAWLRHAVHQYGRQYSAETLIKRATGTTLSCEPLKRMVATKYLP